MAQRYLAVLFDIGGPIDREVRSEAAKDAAIRAAFRFHGVEADDVSYAEANERAIRNFAPDAYRAIIWELAEGNERLAKAVYERFRSDGDTASRVHLAQLRTGLELREGIPELLADLGNAGVHLGLAANQPASALAALGTAGILRWFSHQEVSGHHGFRKPDVRLFIRACEDLGVEPGDAVMVGDRIDNDIVPARVLGMGTVLFRTGRHARQQPRSWDEVPDAAVHDVPELRAVLGRIVRGFAG